VIGNYILFCTYILLLFISLIGYGLLFSQIFKFFTNDQNTTYQFGEIGFFSIIILIPISIILNFVLPINFVVSFLVSLFGIIIFLIKVSLEKYYKKLLIFFIILILSLPYFILITHHDDFYYYHLPYLNVLQFSNIIFGLANLNSVLAYPQNLWFNIFSLFRLPIIDYNGLQVLNGIYTFFFIIFCFENYFKTRSNKIKIILLSNIVFVLVLFSRLKDHGAEIIPQLLMLIVFLYCFFLLFDKNNNKKNLLFKILIIFTISIFLRLSSVIIFPFLIFILILNFNILIQVLKKIKILVFVSILILMVLSKNFINSGCLVYPLSFTCFNQNQVSWSIDKDIAKINENVILSFTRGWMIYAKENTPDANKFIFNPNKNLLSHKQYLSQKKNFWIKYWAKDPDIIRILNIFLIGIFISLFLFLSNSKNFKINYDNQQIKTKIFAFIFLLGPIIFWLLYSTPSTRYGGYALFITIVSYSIGLISNIFIKESINLKYSFVFLLSISLIFFIFKNIDRVISSDNNYPWPKKIHLKKNIDYFETEIDNFTVNIRVPTNKLLMGKIDDENNYILHCGNINQFCTPIKKIQCIDKIYKKLNFFIITSNKTKCIELHKKHALY
tara:strand:+ start:2364 stop:4199 length:1836 start_codon:yes stop_codon:yes gene_type:complete